MSATDKTADQGAEKPAKPFLSVVRGEPTDEDVAVLTAVFAAAASSTTPPVREPENKWGRPVDRLRPTWGLPTSFVNRY